LTGMGLALRATARIGSLAIAAIALAGCLDAPAPTASATAAPATPEPTPVTTSYQPGATVWYEGLVIHVASAVATLDARGGPVELRLVLENPNEDDGELDARVLLQAGGDASAPPVAMTRDSKIPTVPAHGSVAAVLTYELQGVASLEDAAVLIGEAPNHVARVPLTDAGGTPFALQPVSLTLSGRGDAGTLRMTLRSGVIRWDLPDWSQELSSDLEVITLTYDVGYTAGFSGGYAFTGANVALRLPDGTVVEARRDGHSQSVELIGAHQTRTGMLSRFEIPNGTTGKLTVLVRNGKANDTIRFTVPG
jgi:hypothetical protein